MDIRIGNDIRLAVSVSEVTGYTASDIIKTVGKFINVPSGQFPGPKCSSKYTVHGCGLPTYNVDPIQGSTCVQQSHGHGPCVYEDFNSPAKLDSTSSYIYSYFPAMFQVEKGAYNFILEVWVKDETWDEGIRLFTILCGNQFNLTEDGVSGSLAIVATRTSTPDLYVTTLTDSELSNVGNNYIQLMMDSTSYNLDSIPYSGIPVTILSSQRIVIISKYNTLSVTYNGFLFPMSIIKLSDTCYLYKSSYTYSNNSILLGVTKVSIPVYTLTDSEETGPVVVDTTTIEVADTTATIANCTVTDTTAVLTSGSVSSETLSMS